MSEPKRKASDAYQAKLKDPRWQKKRLEILSRDEWMCQSCQDTESMLVVHHRFYEKNREPWEAGNYALVTLCQPCHEHEHDTYPPYADDLIKVIKSKGFLADDLFLLLEAFHGMRVRNAPEFMASLLKFALTDQETMDMVEDRYHQDTKRRIEARKQKAPDTAKPEGDNGQTA